MEHYQAQHVFQPIVPNTKMDPADKDEGYSEDTRSQDGLDSPIKMESGEDEMMPSPMAFSAGLPAFVLGLSEEEKSEFAYNLLRTLRVSSISGVVDRLWPLFHKDPIEAFPPEIMSQVFSYLTPPILLEASRVSKAWRGRVLESGLWKLKFKTEGWGLDMEEVERFERNYDLWKNGLRPSLGHSGHRRQKRPFRTDGRRNLNINPTKQPQGVQKAFTIQAQIEHRDPVELGGDQDHALQDFGHDEEMLDVEANSLSLNPQDQQEPKEGLRQPPFSQNGDSTFHFGRATTSHSTYDSGSQSSSELDTGPRTKQHLVDLSTGQPKLNYHHVFKQKRKLEENWNAGQYRNFQLPHRDHPEDAHTECVYTIQYLGKHLVSGSRDRTLRVWDLDTQRLVGEPLQGHTGSVLCLQFDNRQGEDIIISGSSDTHVILWEFSTGRMIKQLTNAHRESVLNLKFDKRFLVTCSKDKTIKIWNRHELRPCDRDYPKKGIPSGGSCPAYIIDQSSLGSGPRADQLTLLEPYTHLMTLDQHGAAVNAIQIYKDQLVSASGDRNLRVWDIHKGECPTKIEAHAKGIACVQYDGKRIVSGSSDNTIRIWDPVSKSEVARLEGHTRLVRTIQAAFADYPGGRENLEKEALKVDRDFQAASIAGQIPLNQSARNRPGKPGSRKPKDHKTVGAKIPPSGGGGKWGRIVSGSYDETIIIWKKTEDDEWVIGHTLRQEEALRAAGPPLIPRSDVQAQAQAQAAAQTNQTALAQPPIQPVAVHGPLPAHQIVSNAAQAGFQQGVNQPHNTLQQGWNNPALARAYHQLVRQQRDAVAVQNQPTSSSQHQAHQQHLAGSSNAPQNPNQAGNQQQPLPVPPPFPPAHAPRPPGAHQNQPAAAVGQPNARVFKLQFDARRIICCSQDPKIVGWDFANGDEDIIECSRFFAAPQ